MNDINETAFVEQGQKGIPYIISNRPDALKDPREGDRIDVHCGDESIDVNGQKLNFGIHIWMNGKWHSAEATREV